MTLLSRSCINEKTKTNIKENAHLIFGGIKCLKPETQLASTAHCVLNTTAHAADNIQRNVIVTQLRNLCLNIPGIRTV
jgi:hypothetical protein